MDRRTKESENQRHAKRNAALAAAYRALGEKVCLSPSQRRTRLTILRAAISKIHRLQYTLKTPTLHKHMSMSDMDMTELFRKVLLGGFLHTSEEKLKENKDLEGPNEFFIHVRDKILQLPAHHKKEDLLLQVLYTRFTVGVGGRTVRAGQQQEKPPKYTDNMGTFDGLPCLIDLFKAGDWFIKFDLLNAPVPSPNTGPGQFQPPFTYTASPSLVTASPSLVTASPSLVTASPSLVTASSSLVTALKLAVFAAYTGTYTRESRTQIPAYKHTNRHLQILFFTRTIPQWDSLPGPVVMAPNVESFRAGLAACPP
ncbi:hypothetical protein Bbelb_036510 [Branchiostoma belcheri]|nr:hypothetical protein Bbelb_036510 [Branchiostoma belcheri]